MALIFAGLKQPLLACCGAVGGPGDIITSGELKGLKTRVLMGCRAERAAGYGGCIRAAAGARAVAAVQV